MRSPLALTFLRRLCSLSAASVLALPMVVNAAHGQVRYRLTVHNTWSSRTHPSAFPPNAHFSWMAGGTHNAATVFWQVGQPASPGMVQMAETGYTTILETEVARAKTRGNAASVLGWHHWFCPVGNSNSRCGSRIVEFDVDDRHPLITLVTMLGPSPDWFVGVAGLPLRVGGQWRPRVVVDLRPYDGGSRSANAWTLGGSPTVPRDPISRITTASGQLVGPASLGTFTFELLPKVSAFGASCGPTLDAPLGSQPALGTTFTLRTGNLPSSISIALISVGVSKSQILGVPLPLRLDFLGMKGCFLYHSFDAAWTFPTPNGAGQVRIAIPNHPGLVGARVYFQSAAGAVTSNAVDVLVGNR